MKLLLVAIVALACCASLQALEVKGIDPDQTVVYKTVGKAKLKLHIFTPEGHKPTDKRPAVVFFFGGGWTGGSPSQFFPHCEYLASRGMVAMSADYRVKSRNQTPPSACVEDGKSAVRYIRQHATELGVDPGKIAAGGGSAGGHVAAATGTVVAFEPDDEDLEVSSRPAALALFNPVFDNGPGGYGHNRVKEYWKDISPMHNLSEETPPTIVFLGTKDKLIPVETAKEYKRRMEEKGGRCELHLYEGQGHGFFNPSKSKNSYLRTVVAMDRFFASLGYLEGEPTLDEPDEPKEVPLNSTYKLTLSRAEEMFLQKEVVTLETLPEAIKQMRETIKNPTLIIAADKDVPWERIVVVTDIARQAGQVKVNFKINP